MSSFTCFIVPSSNSHTGLPCPPLCTSSNLYEHYCKTTGIEELMKKNKKYKEVIDKLSSQIKLYGKYYQSRYTHRWLNNLQQQCKKQKEINQKAIEYIKERFYFNEETGEYALLHTFDKCNVKELLDILNEVSE